MLTRENSTRTLLRLISGLRRLLATLLDRGSPPDPGDTPPSAGIEPPYGPPDGEHEPSNPLKPERVQ